MDSLFFMPPESFEKYRAEQQKFASFPKEEDYGNIPPESFKKYQEPEEPEMDYSV